MPDMPPDDAPVAAAASDPPPAYVLPAENVAARLLSYRLEPENDCPQATEEEIVVCAPQDISEEVRLQPIEGEQFQDADYAGLQLKIGDLEVGAIQNADGTYGFGLRLKF